MTVQLELIVARSSNGVIGREGTMPWHLPEDLRHFKETTMGCPVIMGRRTHESIGRVLPGRRNIVVSRNPAFCAPGCEVVGKIEEAAALCDGCERAFIIGGAQIYRLALPMCKTAWVTEIDAVVDGGDAFFDALPEAFWTRTVLREVPATDSTPRLVFCRYDRKPA